MKIGDLVMIKNFKNIHDANSQSNSGLPMNARMLSKHNVISKIIGYGTNTKRIRLEVMPEYLWDVNWLIPLRDLKIEHVEKMYFNNHITEEQMINIKNIMEESK